MPEDPLSAKERDLAALAAARTGFDGYLAQLVDLADHGGPTYVGMIVNGLIVIGLLSPSEKFAESVDEGRAWLANVSRRAGPPEGLTEQQFEENLAAFSTLATRSTRARQEEEDKIVEEAEPYVDDDGALDFSTAPADLARRVMRTWYRNSATLTEVQIFAPGQTGLMRLRVMRVALDQIAAWWVLPLDPEGRSSFSLFTTENP